MIHKHIQIRLYKWRVTRHISGKYYYLGKKRSYGDKPSELNFYQNERILSIYNLIFIYFTYDGNQSSKIKMASFTQQLFQSWPSYWSTHVSNLEQGSRYLVKLRDWVLTNMIISDCTWFEIRISSPDAYGIIHKNNDNLLLTVLT